MAEFTLSIHGLKELQAAARRNPQKVLDETGKFLARGIAAYNRVIMRNPWRRNGGAGGAPVATGNLRDTHHRQFSTWEARIVPTAPYASYVHGGTRKMSGRPWLDHARDTADQEIQGYERDMLKAIVEDLAK